jgi:hypothetical protein
MQATPEASFSVLYKGQGVGEYFADILVEVQLRHAVVSPRELPETYSRVEARPQQILD